MSRVWINNREQNSLSLPHRGLAYGDGLFETMRVNQGQIPLKNRHIERLSSSSKKLFYVDQDISALIKSQLDDALHQIGSQSGVFKLILLRSHQGRGYAHKIDNEIDLIVEFYPSEFIKYGWDMPGITLGCCSHHISINPSLAGHKHLNRLDSVLAAQECKSNGWDDGLLLVEGEVIETTCANIFIIKNKNLITPPIEKAGVNGISRSLILDTAISIFDRVLIEPIKSAQIANADFIFITNAVIIARPVSQLVYDGNTTHFSKPNKLFNQLTTLLSGVF